MQILNLKSSVIFGHLLRTGFHDWLYKPLLDKEKRNNQLVELHQFGNAIASVIKKEKLVMLVPTYLLDDIGWYSDKLGICLYVRQLLNFRS
ncbi:hypothetical protein BC936DRAFT_143819 [Jimgerdemannia flammicorona]|uniref:Uncharacterized protein n=1 Tax=Jimgerdemannia flammicorona TaxID=994334 RepID=A0A432ZYH9_9FUNG|nr:hypothetical protein BC936DRAFT_143819 [Jimgerdemannia flammicorona]